MWLLFARSSNVRVSSGVKTLDEMCGGGFFKDSIILATGATGTGKTMLVSKFLENACIEGDRAILFAYEGIISGSPTRVTVDEKTELARIVKGFQEKSRPDSQR